MGEQVRAELSWHRGLKFVARSGSGHGVLIDSPGRPDHLGAGPMELMLMAVAGCTAMDVVAILEKMRESLTGLTVEITGERAVSNPKYYTSVEICYRLKGAVLSPEKVERAIALSHSTYCSALATLRPDCRVTSRFEIADS